MESIMEECELEKGVEGCREVDGHFQHSQKANKQTKPTGSCFIYSKKIY